MNQRYLAINDVSKQDIIRILSLLQDVVCNSGGDGDAMWYSNYYSAIDIYNVLKEFNDSQDKRFRWEIELKDDSISWGDNQEWVVITNNEYEYKNCPPWVEFQLKY